MNKNLKLLLKAALLTVGMFLIGYVVGRVLGHQTRDVDFKSFFKIKDHNAFGIFLAAIHIAATFIPLICAAGQFYCIKKQAANRDPDDEDLLDEIENNMNNPLKLVSTGMILNTILYSCTSYFLLENIKPIAIVPNVAFLAGMIWFLIMNEKIVSFEKELNPEKRGSTFDPKFQKKWIASCDEAQKQIIWRAGFEAYRAGTLTCYVVWMAAFILQMLLRFGLMPMICIGIIWLAMNTAYVNTAAKLEAHGYTDD